MFKEEWLLFLSIIVLTFYIHSGFKIAVINSSEQNNNNDLDLLLSIPLSGFSILMKKYLEINFLKELNIACIVTVVCNQLIFQISDNILFSYLFSISLVVCLFLLKLWLFKFNFVSKNLVNLLVQMINLLMFTLIFLFLVYIISHTFQLPLFQIINFLNRSIDLILLVDQFQLISVGLTIVFANLLILINLVKTDRNIFKGLQKKKNIKSKSSNIKVFNKNRVFTLFKLNITYLERQKKREMLITHVPYLSYLILISGVSTSCVFLFPETIESNAYLIHIIFSVALIYTSTESYAFLSSIDFHQKGFFVLKAAGVKWYHILITQITIQSLFTSTVIVLFNLVLSRYSSLTFSGLFLICLFSFMCVLVFNIYYLLSSSVNPKFEINLISSLPSFKAKLTTSILKVINIMLTFSLTYLVGYENALLISIVLIIIMGGSSVYLFSVHYKTIQV
ncbi:hypothetical protein HXZ66_01125 [Bacillus sp. A116_S68]|nr:hypothetical protein HXZ66_01125 [Bacillus sp. A116_S68]